MLLRKPAVNWTTCLALFLVSLASVEGAEPQGEKTGSARPNIIFIMADDLGYADLSCYGQKTLKTPNIDRLASEGMKFTDFYAGSTVCAPSRSVLMTGFHTGHAFIRGNGKDNLRPSDVTVAETLKEAGYATGLFGKWGIGHEGSTGVPTRQGFDEFFGYLDQHHAHNYYPTFLVRGETRVPLKNKVPKPGKYGQGIATEKVEYTHDLIANEALGFVDRHHEHPFFIYLALTIPHANNEAGPKGMEVPDLGEFANRDWPEPDKGFAAMVDRMDRDIGRLLARLAKYNIDKNTVVFFTSDNGPHAEGGHDPDIFDSNGRLRGIKRDLYEGGIRVPFLARWPGTIEAGSKSKFIGAFWDILPTLADLGGASKFVPKGIDGLSFAPTLLKRGEQTQHQFLYWAFYERGGSQAVRFGKWKAVEQPKHTPIQLYDLTNDIGEQNDVAAKFPEIVSKAKEMMDKSYAPNDRWKFPAKRKRK